MPHAHDLHPCLEGRLYDPKLFASCAGGHIFNFAVVTKVCASCLSGERGRTASGSLRRSLRRSCQLSASPGFYCLFPVGNTLVPYWCPWALHVNDPFSKRGPCLEEWPAATTWSSQIAFVRNYGELRVPVTEMFNVAGMGKAMKLKVRATDTTGFVLNHLMGVSSSNFHCLFLGLGALFSVFFFC